MKFMRFFKFTTILTFIFVNLININDDVFAENISNQYDISEPIFNFKHNNITNAYELCSLVFNQTTDVCELTSSKNEDGTVNINLLIKIRKNENNEKDKNNNKNLKGLLLENLHDKLIAAIAFEPSKAQSLEESDEIKHRTDMTITNSDDPNFEKFLNASFILNPEEYMHLKQLQHNEKKGAGDDLVINIYKNEVGILNLIGHFTIREEDPNFI